VPPISVRTEPIYLELQFAVGTLGLPGHVHDTAKHENICVDDVIDRGSCVLDTAVPMFVIQ